MVRVVAAVSNDQMIHKLDAHHVAGLLDAFCQVVVSLTGFQTARRVVMTDGHDGGIA